MPSEAVTRTGPRTTIAVRGARVHNLKNVSVEIPRNSLVVVTGLSGSGKSSLAFDTIYAEGQRRYMESLSSYAKRFVAQVAKPDVVGTVWQVVAALAAGEPSSGTMTAVPPMARAARPLVMLRMVRCSFSRSWSSCEPDGSGRPSAPVRGWSCRPSGRPTR